MTLSDPIVADPIGAPGQRTVLVDAASGGKPKTVALLSDWEYLERSIQRLIAGWGRYFAEWNDKVAVHRQIWEQAECVRRLRERLTQFPGSVHNLDRPVSARLEALANTVLLAPSHQDAVDGIYQLLTGALTGAYLHYIQHAHPIHDAPTVAMLHEIVSVKEQQRLWLRDYRRRYPHAANLDYRAAIERELATCGLLHQPLPVDASPAAPAGVNTNFRLPARPAYPVNSRPQHDFMPFVSVDFPTSVETRRLFWCYGYMREMNLAIDQLRWIYDSPYMPWAFHQDIARHLWDESRHGDSGYSRLLDFGITLSEIGLRPYDASLLDPQDMAPAAPQFEQPGAQHAMGQLEPLSPRQLYDVVFDIGMVAETGHFNVKREAYEDFKAGGDLESAEMMLFDIIDESAHVQYAHQWLPLLAERAGVDNAGYRERGVRERQRRQEEHNRQRERNAARPRDPSDPDYAFYQRLLAIMREKHPLTNADTCPPRSPLPM
ncbi:MAG TPA: hypothetical protein VFU22_12430 [Roseiflexaceae bacterium]|nr:hypothetical protein [Roseiflexaceae bacterium]